jgi:KaiC/GvpD/RAD55 family RecA-like ATPase
MSAAIIARFLAFQQQIRIYHWSTRSYARHVSSGSLYESLDTWIDKFVEILQKGKDRIFSKSRITITLSAMTDKEAVKELSEFSEFLDKEVETFVKKKNDLKTIRDEILGLVNQTLYLFSFKK